MGCISTCYFRSQPIDGTHQKFYTETTLHFGSRVTVNLNPNSIYRWVVFRLKQFYDKISNHWDSILKSLFSKVLCKPSLLKTRTYPCNGFSTRISGWKLSEAFLILYLIAKSDVCQLRDYIFHLSAIWFFDEALAAFSAVETFIEKTTYQQT